MADLDMNKLKQFIAIAKESGATELKFENADEKYCINFAQKFEPARSFISPGDIATGETIHKSQSAAQVINKTQEKNGLLDVTSPFVGTFYRSPSPGVDHYAKQGDRVSKGQVLCIVEAMKIMNEIESEISGEIVEICADNESYVEFGQVLFRVKP